MADELHQRLDALNRLRGGDRRAVLQRLSLEERRVLDALRTLASAPQAKPPVAATNKPPPPACSPWLAKKIALILDDRTGQGLVTTHARDALCVVVAGERRRS